MHKLIWLLKWVLNAAIFFTLFAFALNNQQDTTVHFFFGNQWQAPQVLVVLGAFAIGVAVGVLGMLPWWWRTQRSVKPAKLLEPHAVESLASAKSANPVSAPAYADGI